MQSANFQVDAALLRELGVRLIGRSYIALAELVKNSYDADALNCTIDFAPNRIVVADNGHGMSPHEFHQHWMRIGTTHKTAKTTSRHLHRPLTGSKGIGRLSVQFLADEMTIESTSRQHPSEHLYAIVDWTDLHHGTDLANIEVLWEMRPGTPTYPNRYPTGTRVILNNLRHEWTADDLEKLGRDIWLLRSPFDSPQQPTPSVQAQDFYVDVFASKIHDAKDHLDKVHSALFASWKARIRGSLQNGRSTAKATLDVEYRADYPKGSPAPRSFRALIPLPVTPTAENVPVERAAIDRAAFDILVFKTERRQASGISVADVRAYLRAFGNVSVYDAGFRLPYYGASHDWLAIAEDQGRRVATSTLLPERLKLDGRYLLDLPAPGRIFGAVRIDTNHERVAARGSLTPHDYLQIQPGRDRLTANTAYRQLRRLVRFALDFYANRFRFLTLQYHQPRAEPPSRVFDRALLALDRNKDAMSASVYRDVRREVRTAATAAKATEDDLDRRAALLAPLATAGLTALALNHELAREILSLQQVARRLRDLPTAPITPALHHVAADVEAARQRFRSLQELFTPLLSTDDRTARHRLLVRPVVRHVVHAMTPLMPGVHFDTASVSATLRFPLGSFAEWNAILQNLLSNAWNAMLTTPDPAVLFEAGTTGRRHWLRLSDTGVGLAVPLTDSGALFEPFERRLEIRAADRSIAMGGQGLGLAIVRMIAHTRSTKVRFVRPSASYSTTVELFWQGSAT